MHKVRLGEIAATHNGAIAIGPFGSAMKADTYSAAGVPVIRGTNISDTRAWKGDWVFVPETFADRMHRCTVRYGDLVLPHRGSIGEVAIIPDGDMKRYILSSSLMKITLDPKKAVPLYVYYYLRSAGGRNELLKFSSQVGTPGIGQPLQSLRQVGVPLPPLADQSAIASILGALDDKIDLNRRMNETLEAMARAIFQDWFVTFGPTRAKQEGRPAYLAPDLWSLFPDRLDDDGKPEGWARTTLRDLAAACGGKIRTGPFGSQLHQADYRQSGTPVVMPTNLTSGEIVEDGIARIDPEMAQALAEHAMSEGDIVYGRRGDIGRKALVGPDEAGWLCGTGCLRISIRSAVCSPLYLFYHLDQPAVQEWISTRAIGATMANLNTGILGSVEIATPSVRIAEAFVQVVEPLTQKARANRREGKALAATRDLLLPKLMSGELRIRDAERVAENVL
jgi:type I restriction enzyme S subunit